MSDTKLKIGISQGDINGIGLEVILKTFQDHSMLDICTPVLFGSQKTISFHKKALGLEDFNYSLTKDLNNIIAKKFNLINCYEEEVVIEFGKATKIAGAYALKSLQAACDALKNNKIDALVTAPINKHNINSAEFPFKGHTEFLEKQFAGTNGSLMLLTEENLKVGLVTEHIALKDVAQFITTEKIIKKALLLNESLIKDFRISKPKIAILALNPHAGDNGTIGDEENKIIATAIKNISDKNILAYGPYPADGFFGKLMYTQFDAVLAMYHDQGLIPFKTIAFEKGSNYTAGLSIIRTSPDHGTAYDIAGKNCASEESFRNAIYTACDIYKARNEYKKLTSNPLKTNISKEVNFSN